MRHLAAAVAAGSLAGLFCGRIECAVLAGVAAAVAVAVARRTRSRAGWLCVVVALGAGLGTLRGSGARADARERGPARGTDDTGTLLVEVEGVVTRGVDLRDDPFARPGARAGATRIATFEMRGRDAAAAEFGVAVHVRLEHGAGAPRVLPGDRVRVLGRIARVRAPSNPGQHDRLARLRRRGITHDLRAPEPAAVTLTGVEAHARWSPRRWGERTRSVLLSRLREACGGSGRPACLLACLLVGDRSGVDDATRTAFRHAGVAHLLAVSGLHVVLLTSVLAAGGRALAPAPWRHRLGLLATLALLIGYCAVCRFSTPVVRAAVFLGVRAIAHRAGRRSATLDQLGAAACLVLLVAPSQILDVGFQLSFAAVTGLVLLTRGIRQALFGRLDLLARFPEALPRWRLRLYLHLAGAFSASCAAQAATAPVLAARIGELHAVGAFTNLAAVPLAAAALPAAAAMALLGDLVPALTVPLAHGLHGALTTVVHAAPEAPALLSAPGRAGPLPVALAVMLLALAASVRKWRPRHLLLPLGAWLVLTAHPHAAPTVESPELVVLDVGHGSCALVRSPTGTNVLFDAGGRMPGVGRRVILPALRSLGVRRVAAVIVSHDDADHCGAVAELLEEVRVDAVIVPLGFGGGAAARGMVQACERYRVPVRPLARGDAWAAPGVTARVLHPGDATGGPAENAGSLVAHVTADGAERDLRVLFPGDLDGDDLLALAADPTLPSAEVLVLPHHGLEDSAVQRALARRAGARTLIASASRTTPPPLPGALVTGRVGALRVRPGRPPWSFRTGSPVAR